ncbi:MAG TPA: PEGA domain-containing protein [Kofleriaceae bacterium]|nr:PEGA domain-containing protein [Kofleriaceae bacterium]
MLRFSGEALAGPRSPADADWQRAEQLHARGDYETALPAIDHGLAATPGKDVRLRLLGLRGAVLLKLRDYAGAIVAYEAYLAAGATGENRRVAIKIIESLRSVESTFVDVTVDHGPAVVYLDSKTEGVFCTAAPTCHRPVLPGDYKVIVERDGFERWTGRVVTRDGQTAKLTAALAERSSLLTVRVTPPGATVTVDDAAYPAPAPVTAGSHRIIATLAGHVAEHRDIAVHDGKPAEIEIALVPLVAIRVAPLRAQLALDGKPIEIDHGGIAVPPGAHVLVVRAAGYHERRVDIAAARAADYELAVELDRDAPPALPSTSSLSGRRKAALAIGAAAPLAGVLGLALGLESSRLDSEAFELCPSPSTPCDSARTADQVNQRARSRALQADLAFGVAGAAAITAAILWFTGAPAPRVTVTPRADPHAGSAGLDLAVRF